MRRPLEPASPPRACRPAPLCFRVMPHTAGQTTAQHGTAKGHPAGHPAHHEARKLPKTSAWQLLVTEATPTSPRPEARVPACPDPPHTRGPSSPKCECRTEVWSTSRVVPRAGGTDLGHGSRAMVGRLREMTRPLRKAGGSFSRLYARSCQPPKGATRRSSERTLL